MSDDTEPTTADAREIRYRVSPDGTITDIDGDWDRFAMENATPELMEKPIGSPLLEHVAGPPVRALIEALLERAREAGAPLEVGYRCDSPDCRRFMRLRLESEPDGSVLFRSWIEREEFRDPVPLLDPEAERSAELLEVCAWCRRVKADGEWVPVEEAVERLQLFGEGPMPEITHAICPGCKEDVLQEDV